MHQSENQPVTPQTFVAPPSLVEQEVQNEQFFAQYISDVTKIATADTHVAMQNAIMRLVRIRHWLQHELNTSLSNQLPVDNAFFTSEAPPLMLPNCSDISHIGDLTEIGRLPLLQYLIQRRSIAHNDYNVQYLFGCLGELFDVLVFKEEPKHHYINFPTAETFLLQMKELLENKSYFPASSVYVPGSSLYLKAQPQSGDY